LNAKTLNAKSISAMCDKCVMIDKHDLYVLNFVAKPFKKTVASESIKKPRNNVRKLNECFGKIYKWSYIKFTPSGYKWKPKLPTGNVNPNLIEIVLFIVDSGCSKHKTGNLKLLINFVEKFLGTVKFGNDQITPILGYGDLVQGAVMIKRVYYVEGLNHNLFSISQFFDADLEYAFRKSTIDNDIYSTVDACPNAREMWKAIERLKQEIVLFIVDSGCSKHKTGILKLLINSVEKYLGTVKFGNDQITPILGYGDLVQGAVMIKRVYYVEGLNHNLFSISQFFDADLEYAFRKSTCFIRDLKGNDLLTGSRGTDLYSITLQDSDSPNLICLMAKATSSQAWLWHRRLSHLKFGTINLLSKNDIVVGLPKLKFIKDHLCSSCELGKAKRKSFHSKLTPSSKKQLHLLHMDLCGPMRVESINGKRYVLVIVDDYSRYTWTHFPRSRDETPEVLIDFLRLVQRGLQAQVRVVRTDKGMKILNQTLHADGENLDKMKEKGDECIFVGYSTQSRAYRVFNKRTRVIMESIHVNFDELPQMASAHNSSDPAPTCQTLASVQISSDPAPECQTVALEHDSLSPRRKCQENISHGDKTGTTSNELDLLFSLKFDELLNGSSKVVSKSSAVSDADAPNERQQLTTPLNNHTTPAPTYDEFINIFSTPVQDQRETSSRHVDSSNMHTFYQRYPSEQRWTKDHPLEQVIGNPSQSVRTRRQLESDTEMCMFALTVSRTEPKNIKEAMADYAWIESMQEELHQFDRLDLWELVHRPLCTNVINLKWLWKNKRDEENIVIRNKSRLVA
nr:retrovirus-related Pol polyprotein from transposon TNT 1-94 [Tanacetum cinerariifolium]